MAKLNPADISGYERFLEYASGAGEEAYVKLGATPFLDFASMVRASPRLARYQAWRSIYSIVSSFVKHEKLREALSFHRSEEHTSELQSLMRISYAVFCLKKKKIHIQQKNI